MTKMDEHDKVEQAFVIEQYEVAYEMLEEEREECLRAKSMYMDVKQQYDELIKRSQRAIDKVDMYLQMKSEMFYESLLKQYNGEDDQESVVILATAQKLAKRALDLTRRDAKS